MILSINVELTSNEIQELVDLYKQILNETVRSVPKIPLAIVLGAIERVAPTCSSSIYLGQSIQCQKPKDHASKEHFHKTKNSEDGIDIRWRG